VVNGGLGSNSTPPVKQNYTEKYGTSIAYIQFNYDNSEDTDGNLNWTAPSEVKYTSDTNLKVEIPSTNFRESVKVRLCNPEGTCGSDFGEDETDFDVLEMRLPPGELTVYTDGINNDKQCIPKSVSFKFNVSHLAIANYRAPYTMTYQLMPISSQTTKTPTYTPSIDTYQTKITANQQLITINNIPNIVDGSSNYTPDSCKVRIILTDNVGCTSSPVEIGPLKLPTNPLKLKWSKVETSNDFSNKTITLEGGIPPYETIVGPKLEPTATTATSTVPTNFIITATVEDSIGCSVSESST
jgi:hypothetical protein